MARMEIKAETLVNILKAQRNALMDQVAMLEALVADLKEKQNEGVVEKQDPVV